MRKTTLAAVFALLVGALPLAATTATTTAVSAAVDTTTKVHVINALGNYTRYNDGSVEVKADVDADVSIDCATEQSADIPVVDPNGDAADGSHTFTLPDGTDACHIEASATSETATGSTNPGYPNPVETDFSCEIDTGFSSSSYYKLVIEPIYTTLANTTAAGFPIALTGCKIHKWQDDTSILPNGYARFTVRHAACETGKNFHVSKVTANGNEVLGPINVCQDATVELPEGVYDFKIYTWTDPNGDGDDNDLWTVFSPNPGAPPGTNNDPTTCDKAASEVVPFPNPPASPTFDLTNCPTIDEGDGSVIELNDISLAHGQAFVFNAVDSGLGQFIPFLAGGATLTTTIPGGGPNLGAANPGYNTNCDTMDVVGVIDNPPGGAPEFAVRVPTVALGTTLAPNCHGGGLGIIAGASTVQVQFVPNQLPASNPALQEFCTNMISNFQATVKAETDILLALDNPPTLDATYAPLETAVNNTDALIQKLLAQAPLEIRPQIVILTTGLDTLNKGLRAASFNPVTLGASGLTAIQDGLKNPPPNPEVDAARAVLTDWIIGNCFPASPSTPPPASQAAVVTPTFTG